MTTGQGAIDWSGLLANPFYAAMPEGARAQVQAQGRLRKLAKGQQLWAKGDPSDGVYALVAGKVEYSTVSPSGRHSIVNVVEVGKWLGDISTLDGAGRTLDCRAIEDSHLFHLKPVDFSNLLDTVPPFARMLILMQAQRVRDALVWIEALTKLDAEGRLAQRLLLFAQARGRQLPAGTRIELSLTQEEMADYIGTTRQRVNQILNQWQQAGLIRLEGRHVVLLNEDRLRHLVDLA